MNFGKEAVNLWIHFINSIFDGIDEVIAAFEMFERFWPLWLYYDFNICLRIIDKHYPPECGTLSTNYEILRQHLPRTKTTTTTKTIEKSKLMEKNARQLLFIVIATIMDIDWMRLHVSNTGYNLFSTLNQTGNVERWREPNEKIITTTIRPTTMVNDMWNMKYFLLRNLKREKNPEKEELRHRLMDVWWTALFCFGQNFI